jgi:hypothetical protein
MGEDDQVIEHGEPEHDMLFGGGGGDGDRRGGRKRQMSEAGTASHHSYAGDRAAPIRGGAPLLILAPPYALKICRNGALV